MGYVIKSDSGYYTSDFTWTDSQRDAKRYTAADKAAFKACVRDLLGPTARFVKIVPRQPF